MSAGYLKNRIFVVAGIATAFLFTFGTFFYAWNLKNAKTADVSKNFYFLVDESTHIEASAYAAKQVGGAGYLLDVDERTYVAVSVYLNGTAGERAKNSFSENRENAELLTLSGGTLYFKKREEKRNSEKIVGAFRSLYGNIEVLEQEIARLEDNATQQSSKRVLRILENNFSYLDKEYKEIFPAYSQVCGNVAESLKQAREGIVYAKELRYLQCELCFAYVDLCKNFSL